MDRDDFFEHGWRAATGLDHMLVGDAAGVADALQENFAVTGGRGGYMLSSPLGMPSGFADLSELLVPELRCRGPSRRGTRGPRSARTWRCEVTWPVGGSRSAGSASASSCCCSTARSCPSPCPTSA